MKAIAARLLMAILPKGTSHGCPEPAGRANDAVELNMAAMLDMAFQLLTFFILTFRPAPVESQISLRMPPAKPVRPIIDPKTPAGKYPTFNPVEGFNTLKVYLIAGDDGGLGQILVQTNDVPVDRQLAALDRALREALKDPASPFEQVVISVSARLHYEQLLQVMDVCSRQTIGGDPRNKLTKLSLVDAGNP